MGVKQLWKVLAPAAVPVRVSSLESMKLAVDISIWLTQFAKVAAIVDVQDRQRSSSSAAATTTEDDAPIRMALKLLFHRICKLWAHGIKPVFVFDGPAPALKRKTVRQRKRSRQQAQQSLKRHAEKALLRQLHLRSLHAIKHLKGKRLETGTSDGGNKNRCRKRTGVKKKRRASAARRELHPGERDLTHKRRVRQRHRMEEEEEDDDDGEEGGTEIKPIQQNQRNIGSNSSISSSCCSDRYDTDSEENDVYDVAAATQIDDYLAGIDAVNERDMHKRNNIIENAVSQVLSAASGGMSASMISTLPLHVRKEVMRMCLRHKGGGADATDVSAKDSDGSISGPMDHIAGVGGGMRNKRDSVPPHLDAWRSMADISAQQISRTVSAAALKRALDIGPDMRGRMPMTRHGHLTGSSSGVNATEKEEGTHAVALSDKIVGAMMEEGTGQEAESRCSDHQSAISVDIDITDDEETGRAGTVCEKSDSVTATTYVDEQLLADFSDMNDNEEAEQYANVEWESQHCALSSSAASEQVVRGVSSEFHESPEARPTGRTVPSCASFQDTYQVAVPSGALPSSDTHQLESLQPNEKLEGTCQVTSGEQHSGDRGRASAVTSSATRAESFPQFSRRIVGMSKPAAATVLHEQLPSPLAPSDQNAVGSFPPLGSKNTTKVQMLPSSSEDPICDKGNGLVMEMSAAAEGSSGPLQSKASGTGHGEQAGHLMGPQMSSVACSDYFSIPAAAVTVGFRRYVPPVVTSAMDTAQRVGERDLSDSLKGAARSAAQASHVTDTLLEEAKKLLRLFGIPFLVAPAEAEAQCAALEAARLVDGIITDDSDVFLFGAKRVYRNVFSRTEGAACYTSKAIERTLGLSRVHLIALALLLGNDYSNGVFGVGAVSAMEIVSAFVGGTVSLEKAPDDEIVAMLQGLTEFRKWLFSTEHVSKMPVAPKRGSYSSDVAALQEYVRASFKHKHGNARVRWDVASSFPDQTIAREFCNPAVTPLTGGSVQELEWNNKVDVAALIQFCEDSMGISRETARQTLENVMDINGKRRQRRVDTLLHILPEPLVSTMNAGSSERGTLSRSKRFEAAVAALLAKPVVL